MRNSIETNQNTSPHSRQQRQLLGAAALLALALPACVGGDEPGVPTLETVAGSRQANELGIMSWQVRTEGDDARIIGLDAAARRRAEVIVRRDSVAPDDRVQIEAVFPERGVFELGRGGTVDGAASELLSQLGVAINADLGERSVSLPSAGSNGLGTAISASTQLLQASDKIEMGWSVFGYRANVVVDGLCGQGTRDHYTAFAPGGSSCWVNRWITDSPYDCAISLHYGIGGGHTDTCFWSVYTNL